MNKSLDKKVWIYIFLAYIFSIAMRLIWVYQFNGYSNFIWNDQFMINTNDGYFWAQGARDLLSGTFTPNSLSPIDTATSMLTYLFAKILPFSFESIIFYMPVFLGSLVVIPMILIANSFKRVELGFVAALLACVAWSYYNRTMAGYYDTDMLNIVLPTFILWSLILAYKSRNESYMLFTALEIVAYRWWYSASYSLEFAFLSLIVLYVLIFERKNTYIYKLLILMLFAMMNLPILVKLLVIVLVYSSYKKIKIDSYIFYLFGISLVLFLFFGGFDPIWAQLKGYVFKDSVKVDSDGLGLHFFSVMQTVREAGKIPFEIFADRISGHKITFLLSCLGYIMMIFRYPSMILGLPMLGLGFLAYVGGLRFTIYAVPIAAFGISYLIFFISDYLKKFLGKNQNPFYVSFVFVSVCTVAILYPNIRHIISYKVPTVFSKNEVKVLDKLKHIVSREDYVVSWWDYGYPIRYYADVKTLVDGGKHTGEVNFPVSYILTNPQNVAAKMARLDTQYTEKAFHYKKDDPAQKRSYIENMTLDYGFKDVNDFLSSLKTDIKLPKKTRDVYIYLPFRMLGIFPTVARFSNLDLMSGKSIRRPFFYQTNRYREKNGILNLANGVFFDTQKGVLKVGNQKVPVKNFYITFYGKNGKLVKQKKSLNQNSNISIIYMKSYNTFLVLDEDMLNSLYIQLFVFDNYDKNLFEPVILSPAVKVYKLKI